MSIVQKQKNPASTLPSAPLFLLQHAGTRGLRRLTPISRPPITGRLGEVFHLAAERSPEQKILLDRPSDIQSGGQLDYSYCEWAAFVDELAGCLVAAGVQPWDRVAIYKRNHFDISALVSAAARIGAIPAPMGQRHSSTVLKALLTRLEQPFLITDGERLDESRLDQATSQTLIKKTIVHGEAEKRMDLIDWSSLQGGAPPAPRLRAVDEVMVIPHTSGTTGIPKLVMHSARSIHAQSHVETERWPLVAINSSDRVALCDPFFHTRVMTALTVMATATPRLLTLSDPNPELVRAVIADFKPTIVETLPNIYLSWESLTREQSRPFGRVRLFVNSFDAIHTRTIRAFLSASDLRLPLWIQSWSQSENGAIAIRPYTRFSVRHVGHRPPPNQELGWPQPIVGKIRAVDPDTGRRVRRGEVGLIEVSLPGRCLGYLGEQDRHRDKTDGQWWHTGDLGVIGRLGAVRLLDREIDRIPGASCIEIEDIILDRLPRTTEVIVLAVPDAAPVPVVCTDNGHPVDPDVWASATRDLPALAKPLFVPWGDLPRTATWKVRRNELRERLLGAQPIGQGHWT